MIKKALIVVNVGTPDDPSVKSVRRYLREFLNDPKVIDIPPLLRKILVNLVIVPFRAPRSAAKYRKLWTDRGSPLLLHMQDLVKKLEEQTGKDTDVYGMMRYGRPALSEILREIGPGRYEEITVLPLYPQFAESTTGSVIAMVQEILELESVKGGKKPPDKEFLTKGDISQSDGKEMDSASKEVNPSLDEHKLTDHEVKSAAIEIKPSGEETESDRKQEKFACEKMKSSGIKQNITGQDIILRGKILHSPAGREDDKSGTGIRIIGQFFDHPSYLDAMKKVILEQEPERFDHVLFSYHGLPLRQVQKCHPGVPVDTCSCHEEMPPHGSLCYQAACFATTRLLAEKTGLKPGVFSTSFQSRLSKNWMSPFTDKTLMELAAAGKKRVLVIPASFVADCLETTFEIGEEYMELFLDAGGAELVMTPSLNTRDEWVEGIVKIVERRASRVEG